MKKVDIFDEREKKSGFAIAITFVFAAVVFSVIFLSTSHANAQDFQAQTPPPPAPEKNDPTQPLPHSPSEFCQLFLTKDAARFYIMERNTENDCLFRAEAGAVRYFDDMSRDNMSRYVHAYYKDAHTKFCVDYTNKDGSITTAYCEVVSQVGTVQQQPAQQPAQQKVQQPAQNIPKLVTPPGFQIKELQYDTLPHGKKIQTGDGEMIELTMPDGSLIQIDANSTFTPVSDDEVQSVFGRYRYLWKPFHDGKCIVGQNLVRQECRKVITRDAIIGDRDTEFLVVTDKSGTTITVLDGLLGVTDLGGKKTVEVSGGQSVYVKHGGLPTDPTPFDSAKIDRWWEKNTPEQTSEQNTRIILFAGMGMFVLVFIIASVFGNSRKKKLALAAASVTEEKKVKSNHKEMAVASFAVGIFTAIASFCLFPWSFSVFIEELRFILWNYRWGYSLFLLIVGIIGLILGIKGARSSRKIFAILGIILNIIGIIGILLWFAASAAIL
ncbi:MAG: FecR family protein [bacterium]|nr:FecR family protein [bacterium]